MEKVRLNACVRHILKNLWDILFSVSNPPGWSEPSQSVKFIKKALLKFLYFLP